MPRCLDVRLVPRVDLDQNRGDRQASLRKSRPLRGVPRPSRRVHRPSRARSLPCFCEGMQHHGPMFFRQFAFLGFCPKNDNPSSPISSIPLATLAMCLCAVSMFSCQSTTQGGTTTPLNVIYIMADDHAYQAISAYGSEISKLAPTPNIDRIAKTGQEWTRFIAPTALRTQPIVDSDRSIQPRERFYKNVDGVISMGTCSLSRSVPTKRVRNRRDRQASGHDARRL